MQLSFALHECLINSYKPQNVAFECYIMNIPFHLSAIFRMHFGTVPSVVFFFLFIP